MKGKSLARKIEALYRRDFCGPFPYQDCYKIQKLQPRIAQALVPDLDMYFSFIAGYSSSATHLDQRPQEEICAVLPRLKQSFYDVCPRYKQLAQHITASDTPRLLQRLNLADQMRTGLVSLIAELLPRTR